MAYQKKLYRQRGRSIGKTVLTYAVVIMCIGLIGTLFAVPPGAFLKPDTGKDYTVLGFTGLTSSPNSLCLTGDAAEAALYTTSSDGEFVSVQNELDGMFPYNRIEEYTDEYGNVFVKFPMLYMKWVLTDDGYIDGVMISDKKVDNTYFVPDAYLSPAGGLVSLRLYNDYFAIGKYEMSGDYNRGYSVSGQRVLTSITRPQARDAVRSYGTLTDLYMGYQQLDLSQWTVYNILCMLYYQTSDISSVCSGRVSYDSAALTGTTDGCTGLNGWNKDTGCVKMLGVENPYGNTFTYLDGLYVQDGVAYLYQYPQYYADSAEGAVKVDLDVSVRQLPARGLKYVSSVDHTVDLKGLFFPAGVPSQDGKYLPSCIMVREGKSMPFVGGCYNSATSLPGLFYVQFNDDATSHNVYRGARLTYRPV